ncbi:hypothetical protein LO763_22300 [Glycomyces sp. A-F 0318]|uniref:hypothetical protein n=1 Tax=Glycomyces amatae TaxID=2881355 RepID=UPI001E406425|nr:hypothetical protein [Glycomyces amatae]MCD0446350.1 hypothetical protein [Glycomyces amatae]
MAQAAMATSRGADRPVAAGLTARLLTVAGHVAYRTSDEAAAGGYARQARAFAEEAADPVAQAEADRVAAVVVRRSGNPAATGLMTAAADQLEHAAGLVTPLAMAAWAETICSAAYTAAGFGALDDADALLHAAQARLEAADPAPFTVNDVSVFAMSAAMNAGTYDRVLERAARVNPERLGSRHQWAHFHKSVAIAAEASGDHDQAVAALAAIDRVAPDFLMYRPWTSTLAQRLGVTRSGGTSPLVQRLAV